MPPTIRIFCNVALRDIKGRKFRLLGLSVTNDVQRFLELMASVPGKFFVPTLDIDLAWQYVGASSSSGL